MISISMHKIEFRVKVRVRVRDTVRNALEDESVSCSKNQNINPAYSRG